MQVNTISTMSYFCVVSNSTVHRWVDGVFLLLAEGTFVPKFPINVESLHVKSDVGFRYARTHVEIKFLNAADIPKETSFNVQLPNDALIVNFTMYVYTCSWYYCQSEERNFTFNDF